MSPMAGTLLVNDIVPIIQAAVPRSVRTVGSEDPCELVQDTIAMAAQLVESCEARGKPVYPNSVAYYAIQHAKHGRRSYGATRTDAMCPAAQLDETVTVASMDDVIPGDHGDEVTMHDLLAAQIEDPAQKAAREVDWAELLEDFNERDIAVLKCTLDGDSMGALAARFGVSGARLSQLKRELGRQVKLRWGWNALADALRDSVWRGAVRARREKSACQYERAMAERSACGGRR